MDFKNTEVMNFKGAFRGLRNPLQSWDKSDSYFGIVDFNYDYDSLKIDKVITDWVNQELSNTQLSEGEEPIIKGSPAWEDLFMKRWIKWYTETNKINPEIDTTNVVCIGPKDLNLAQRMIKAGTSDRKFLRQIFVSVDITAPLYWWKEADTYKIGTTANSTSTMHRLGKTPITKDCFELDDFNQNLTVYNQESYQNDSTIDDIWQDIINHCETLRLKYLETKDKRYWKELIRILPESWLQTRTITFNYEILRNIYQQRRNHKLTEWHSFCEWVETLPYAKDLITYNL